MRNLLYILCFLFSIATQSQEVSGELLINSSKVLNIELKDGNAVELFKDFKIGKYQIQFNFNAGNCPVDEQKRQIVQFVFETEVYQNGKKVSSIKRQPMPFFPGEMLEPVETFDIISALTQLSLKEQPNYPGQLNSGEYKILLKATPIDAEGVIKPVSVVIFI